MDIDIKNDDNKYLTISLSGEHTKQEADKIPKIILKASKDMQNKKILLDTSQLTERVINTFLQFEYGKNLAKQLNGHGIILGIYGDNEIYSNFADSNNSISI